MDLTKYTTDGLNNLLHKAIVEENYELANDIKKELENRVGEIVWMNKETQMDIIIDAVDFEKIHDVMSFLGWRWSSSAYNVPKVEDIIEQARALLNDVWDYHEGIEHVSYETGGLKAERWIYDGVKLLSLSFIIDSFMIDADIVKITKDEYYGNKNIEN